MAYHIDERVGQRLGNYRLLRLLGSGQFAAVYLSEHVYLKTLAAIKVLHMQLKGNSLEAFLSEARTLANMVHPHIVRVLDFGVERDIPFLVMDYAPDGTLRSLYPAGTQLPCASILGYVKQVAAALQYAHNEHLIHRDIKPENMLIGRNNEVLLSDFGIAVASQRLQAPDPVSVMGTVGYAAPEQLQGQPCLSSDQYALGVVVYEWLTGDLPFHGSHLELLAQHQNMQPPPLRSQLPAISPGVEHAVLRALAKDSRARFESVQAFADALEEACACEVTAFKATALTTARIPPFQFGRTHHSPLIGREREWMTLQQQLLATEHAPYPLSRSESAYPAGDNPTRPSTPNCTLIVGEPGIGKTRLAEDLSREAQRRGWAVAWSRGYAHEGNIPYRVWTEVLRNLLTSGTWSTQAKGSPSDTSLAPLSQILPEFSSTTSPEQPLPSRSHQQERLRLWESLREALAASCQRSCLLVVLDDLHSADESSLELLVYLIRHLRNGRVLFVGTFRPAELAPAHPLHPLEASLRYEQQAIKLPLQPLTEEQIGELVSPLAPSQAQEIAALAGGNPLFAEELARSQLAQESALKGDSPSGMPGRPALPDTITAALERRLQGLSAACQQLLSTAAVLGGSFSYTTLQRMVRSDLQEDRVLDLLDEAIGDGMLVEEGSRASVTYHFWHPLLVSYLYDRLSETRKVRLHRVAADVLVEAFQGKVEDGAAAILPHLIACESHPPTIARYAEMAGDHAFMLSAYAEAARHYKLAVTYSERPHSSGSADADEQLRQASLVERLAECQMIQGAYAEARQHYERVRERRAQLAARPANEPRETQIEALLLSEIACSWRMTGEYDRGRACCEKADEALQQMGIGSGPALAVVRLQQSYIDWQEGHNERAHQRASEALRLLEEALQQQDRVADAPPITTRTTRLLRGDPLALGEIHEALSNIASSAGKTADALAHLYTALGIYERQQHPKSVAHVTGNLGYTYLLRGEDSLAQVHLNRSFSLAEQVGDIPVMAVAALNLGELSARTGSLPEAEAWFRRSLALTRQVGDRETMIWCFDSLANACREQGKLSRAADCVQQALTLSRAIQNIPCMGLAFIAVGYVRLAQAQSSTVREEQIRLLKRARAVVKRALSLDRLYSEPKAAGYLALAQVALQLGDLETAWQQGNTALQEALASDLMLVQARSQRLLGSILSAKGQFAPAEAFFEQALQTCRARHMELELARTLQSYGEMLLDRCDPADTSCMGLFEQACDYLVEARKSFTTSHAALDLLEVERILAGSSSKKPYLGFF